MDLLFAAPVSSFEAGNVEDEALLRLLEGHQYPSELDLDIFKTAIQKRLGGSIQDIAPVASKNTKGGFRPQILIVDDISPVSPLPSPSTETAENVKGQDQDDDLMIEPSEPSTSSPRSSLRCESIGTAITTPSISSYDRNSMDEDEIRSIHEEPVPETSRSFTPISIQVERTVQVERRARRTESPAAAESMQYTDWSWPPPPKRRLRNMISKIGSIRTSFKNQNSTDEDMAAVSLDFFKEKKRAVLVKGLSTSGNLVMFSLRRKAPESDCVACMESHPEKSIRRLKCGHNYCKTCLRQLALSATESESTMPPKCCNSTLDPKLIKSVLSRSDQIAFSKKVLEYQTPHDSRLFCASSRCGAFIFPKKRHDRESADPLVARCQDCSFRTCRICKNPAHPPGFDCPEDWELNAVLEMGDTEGWRRCYRCRSLVELTDGCSHMRCRCGAEFCYICGSKWEYQCPQNCPPDAHWVHRMQREQQRAAEARAAEAAQEARVREEADAVRRRREEADNARLREEQAAEERSRKDPYLVQLREKHGREREDFEQYRQDVDMKMKRRHYEERMDLLFAHSDSEMKRKLDMTAAQETHESLRTAEENLLRQKHERSVHLLQTTDQSVPSSSNSSQNNNKYDYTVVQTNLLEYLAEVSMIKSKYKHLKESMELDQQFQEKLLQYRHREEREVMTKRHNAEEELVRRELLRRKIALVDSQRRAMRETRSRREQETGLHYAPEVEMEA